MAAENRAGWQIGRVVETEPVATGIRRIVVETGEPRPAAPGSHVKVVVDIGGRADTRSYSVVSSSGHGRLLTLSVQRAPRSRGGSVFMHALRAGDPVEMSRPHQNFPLRVGAGRYVLLAGGVGITAVAEMARVLRRLKSDYLLVYAGRSREHMAYLADLEQLHGDRIRVHVDGEGTSLDAAALVDEVAAGGPAELYMCGPIGLMDAVRRRWRERALPPADLRYETFGNSGWFAPEEFVVSVPRLGIETVVGAGQSMLDALESAGAEMMSDCRKGECGLCQVKVLDLQGRVDHRDVFFCDEEKRDSRKLCACVSRVIRDSGAGGGPAGEDRLSVPVRPVSPVRPTGERARLTLDIP
ncbi:PDR/VanB family oxidoreductase [Streptomyces sp. NPDC051018]|uniref:PDR/VanB family oxidoreductase n=1 Tax=Streptomyces sp. NPDC051018 TaxID=3365639 RepID=UPI0037950212